MGPGHIDSQFFIRDDPVLHDQPLEDAPYVITDNVLFSKDIAGGPGIDTIGVVVGDRWTWKYFKPGTLPTGTPDVTCYMEILLPGGPNTTPNVALVAICPSISYILEPFPSGCPCDPAPRGIGLGIAGFPAASQRGTWNAVIDYRTPGGTVTPGVVQTQFELRQSPAVVLVHGWRSDCTAMTDLRGWLQDKLGVPPEHVDCFDYEYKDGVRPAAQRLERAVSEFRTFLSLTSSEEVDLVGHSLGGLVARHYVEVLQPDRPIGSLSMLGTPNLGNKLARTVGYVPDFAIGLFDQSLVDMIPESKVLRTLNADFQLPVAPVYQLHRGLNAGQFGSFHPFEEGDCVVATDSAEGPGDVFASTALVYPALSHTPDLGSCVSSSLRNTLEVAENLAVTIREESSSGAGASSVTAALVGGPQAPFALPLSASAADLVLPQQQKIHQLQVPSGPANPSQAMFALVWPANTASTNLTLVLQRPNGSVVDLGDPDVVNEITAADDAFADLRHRAFVISTPQGGMWQFTVTGTSVSPSGQGYMWASCLRQVLSSISRSRILRRPLARSSSSRQHCSMARRRSSRHPSRLRCSCPTAPPLPSSSATIRPAGTRRPATGCIPAHSPARRLAGTIAFA